MGHAGQNENGFPQVLACSNLFISTRRGSDPSTSTKDCKKEWEKRDREEATVEKAATLEAAEEAVEEEGMAEAEEEVTAAAGEAVAAEDMIAVTTATADRTETADRHPSRKVKKSMSRSIRWVNEETE